MRVAFVSPLPPEPTGIGDYSYELLEELRSLVDVTAVVRDDLVDKDRAPEGVEVIGLSDHRAADFDVTVYQMGNNPKYHRYLFGRALDEPGLLVLHDPSLADFYAELCGGSESMIFRDEVAYDRPDLRVDAELPLIDAGEGRRDLDRLEVLLARRLVASNVRTLVHSRYIAEVMRRRYEGADIQSIQLPAQLVEDASPRAGGPDNGVVFGVFGGINYYKRVGAIVDAFAQVHRSFPSARLVVAGRPDDRLLTARIREIARRPELHGSIEVLTDLSLAELEAQMARCDVAISLRWPTAGEMSATLVRTFGAARPAIVSDVPQFRELDESFCWRVPVEPDQEGEQLVSTLLGICAEPTVARSAGSKARAFVASSATYRLVAEDYVQHLEFCARRRRIVRRARQPYSLLAQPVFGVNVIASNDQRSPAAADAQDWAELLRSCGIEARLQLLDGLEALPSRAFDTRWMTDEPDNQGGALGQIWSDQQLVAREIASLAAQSGTYPVDLLVVDAWNLRPLTYVAAEHRARGRRIVALPDPFAVQLDPGLRDLFDLADEVWAPTEAAADACRLIANSPVRVIAPTRPVARDPRSRPQLAEELAICTYVDSRRSLAQVNVAAVIEAYRRAFDAGLRGSTVALTIICDALVGQERSAYLKSLLATVGGRLAVVRDRTALADELRHHQIYFSMSRSAGLDFVMATARSEGLVVLGPHVCMTTDEVLDDQWVIGHRALDIHSAPMFIDAQPPDLPRRSRFLIEPEVADATRALQQLRNAPDELVRGMTNSLAAGERLYGATTYSITEAVRSITWSAPRPLNLRLDSLVDPFAKRYAGSASGERRPSVDISISREILNLPVLN